MIKLTHHISANLFVLCRAGITFPVTFSIQVRGKKLGSVFSCFITRSHFVRLTLPAEGFKMDYGGHDSVYEENLVISYPQKYGQMCVGFGSFYPRHGHVVRRNTCLVPRDEPIIQLPNCSQSNAQLYGNHYFTPSGKATVECGYDNAPIPFEQFQERFELEQGSKVFETPASEKKIAHWALNTLFNDRLEVTPL